MSAIKLITLDLDNTLWDVDSIIVQAEADMVAWLADNAPEALALYQSPALGEVRQEVFTRFQHRSHDLSFMRIAMLTDLAVRAGYAAKEARNVAEQAFAVFFEGRNRVEFFPGALSMLAELSADYPVFALTNGNADIGKAGLSDYLQGAFSSADVGVKKPHPRMFEAPLNLTNVAPEEAVHVGDHLVDDVRGAGDVGMHSVWVNLEGIVPEAGHARPTCEVRALEEVVTAIRQLS